MDKTSFIRLLSLIEDHPVFRNESQHQQAPVIVQLGAALDRLGHDGNGACIARSKELWGYGHGTLVNFTKRVIIAIRDRLHMYVRWPTRAERQRISAEFESKGFPGCVGLIDGTLVKLSQRPCNDGETYFDRKHNYSLNVQVVCDHRRKILFLYGGVPGSCQDITALKRSKLWKYIDAEGGSAVFASNEYLLGDSGYAPLHHLVPAFKGGADDRDKQDFNQCLSHARVVNEHCIGVLKSRWFSLKGIRTQLKKPGGQQMLGDKQASWWYAKHER
ncbi:hypothetical protein R1sor_007632 [Riccia sorocarpa]|uniref:DDE Tnp4 domain-containing protein n=1 Tax=Riccia sorocarpa TaxID=122646 RepID=A0ABD3HT71_9MARC